MRVLAVSAGMLLLSCLALAPMARAETVLTRKRIGNNSEGITYVTSGHWRNRAVAIDGNDVLAVTISGSGGDSNVLQAASSGSLHGPGWSKIFDVLALGADARAPKGIAFVPGRNQFVFGGYHSSTLSRTDQFGNPLPPIVPNGLADPTNFLQYEGLTWIPASAPAHANTIAALLIGIDFLARVAYIRLDGTVEAEVFPQPGTPIESYMCGIAYQRQRPGTLLISECGTGNYAMDEDGNFLGGPILPAPVGSGDIESILVDNFGRVFLGGYDGHLYAYDANYNRLSTSQDHSYVIGLGISATTVTWNPDTRRLIFLSFNHNTVESVPLSLSARRTLFTADPVRANDPVDLSYLGGGQLAIANRSFPRGIQVVTLPNGSETQRLVFLPPVYPAGTPFVTWGAGALGPDQFLVRVKGDTAALKVVSRTGTPDDTALPGAILPDRLPDLPLSSPVTGKSVQVFDSGTGPRIFTGAEIYDLSGNLMHTIDQNALGVTVGLSYGTWIARNTFAGIDDATSTVIIFTVP